MSSSSSHQKSAIRYETIIEDDGNEVIRRTGQLAFLTAYTRGLPAPIDDYLLRSSISGYLAFKHFNERSGTVLSHLPDLLKDCDFYWSLDSRNTAKSQLLAVEHLVDAMIPTLGQLPFAVFGASYSSVTYPLSVVASGAYELPVVSGAATSTALESPELLFGRTVPTDLGRARAALQYFQSLGANFVLNLFEKGPYGAPFNQASRKIADELNMTLLSVAYQKDDSEASLATTFKILKESQYRYVFAVLDQDWEPFLIKAMEHGLLGEGSNRTWITTKSQWTKPMQISNPELARALHGTGGINLRVPSSDTLQQAYRQEFLHNPQNQQDFIHHQSDPSLFQNYTFLDDPSFVNQYTMAEYDAVIAIGLTACRTPGLFTGREFFEQIKQTHFEGASGNVSFDPTTGTRSPETMQYGIYNLVLQQPQHNNPQDDDATPIYHLESNLAATVVSGRVVPSNTTPYVFADNTTNVPPAIPPLQFHNYNLVPPWALAIGYALASLMLVCSIAGIIWTCRHRKQRVVRAAQPFFLCQLCIGCFVLALAVFSFNADSTEVPPPPLLDVACMATPWLLFCGLVVALSALFAKAWRLNKIYDAASHMRRIVIEPRDVMLPFCILMVLNLSLLTAWTIVAPLKFQRVPTPNNHDAFGRALESSGKCVAADDNPSVLFFFIPLLGINVLCVLLAAIQYWKGKDLPTEFSEASHLTLSTASLMETLLLGMPILLVAREDKTAYSLAFGLLIFAVGMSVLVPVFGPKVMSLSLASDESHSQPTSRIGFGSQYPSNFSTHTTGMGTSSRHNNHNTKSRYSDPTSNGSSSVMKLLAISQADHMNDNMDDSGHNSIRIITRG